MILYMGWDISNLIIEFSPQYSLSPLMPTHCIHQGIFKIGIGDINNLSFGDTAYKEQKNKIIISHF